MKTREVRDVMNKSIQVGDSVVFAMTGYVSLYEGTVTKITPKGVKVKGLHSNSREFFRYDSEVIVTSGCY